MPVLLSTARDDLTVSAPQLGKTVAGRIWLATAMWYGGESPHPWWWCAPTYNRAEHGFLGFCEMMVQAGALDPSKYTTTPPLRCTLKNGAKAEARSWEKPQNLLGPTIRGAVLDEFGDLGWRAQSNLSSRRAETVSYGEGRFRYLGNVGNIGGCAEALWDRAVKGEEGFACRRWTWRDRARSHECGCLLGTMGMDPKIAKTRMSLSFAEKHLASCARGMYLKFILGEKSRMSRSEFAQLYGAEWLDWNELPVYEFDRDKHVRDDLRLDRSLPLDLSVDFNVNPMSWVIGQHKGVEAWAWDEQIIEGSATTRQACEKFMAAYPDRDWSVHVYGDASGQARKTAASQTDYQIIESMLGSYYKELRLLVPASNPPVGDRLNAFNARLMSAAGEIRYWLHSRCEFLARDLARVNYKPGTRDIAKTNTTLTHPSDAEGYRMAWLYPIEEYGPVVVGVQSMLSDSYTKGREIYEGMLT